MSWSTLHVIPGAHALPLGYGLLVIPIYSLQYIHRVTWCHSIGLLCPSSAILAVSILFPSYSRTTICGNQTYGIMHVHDDITSRRQVTSDCHIHIYPEAVQLVQDQEALSLVLWFYNV